MPPPLYHPYAATFIDDHDIKHPHTDPASYYGGGETYLRSRTYSHVLVYLHRMSQLLTHE